MTNAAEKRLAKALTPEQEQAFTAYVKTFQKMRFDPTPENVAACHNAYAQFLHTTGGLQPCELIPLSIW